MSSFYPEMAKELERKKRNMPEPPKKPDVDFNYPSMGQPEKVMEAVEILRDKKFDTLNDDVLTNKPATEEEINKLLEIKPNLNTDSPDILQEEVQKRRRLEMLYGIPVGEASYDEVVAARNFVVSDGIRPMQKKQLEQACDAWRKEHGTLNGWEEKRQEMINQMVYGDAPAVDPRQEAFAKDLAELIAKHIPPKE